ILKRPIVLRRPPNGRSFPEFRQPPRKSRTAQPKPFPQITRRSIGPPTGRAFPLRPKPAPSSGSLRPDPPAVFRGVESAFHTSRDALPAKRRAARVGFCFLFRREFSRQRRAWRVS